MNITKENQSNQYILLHQLSDGRISTYEYDYSSETILKSNSDIDRELLNAKKLSLPVLKIEKQSLSTVYLPGYLNYKYIFQQTDIQIRNVLFHSIEHFYNNKYILNVSMFESIPKDKLTKYVIERKIELPLCYSKLAFDIIYFINILIDRNISTTKITNKLQNSPYDTKYSEKSIYYFLNKAIFKTWSEVHSRIGKDNRISSGVIIENFKNDAYLISLMETLNFHLMSDNRLKSHDNDDYGFISSQAYQERIVEGDELKFHIISSLIKLYDIDEHGAYLLLQQ